ncbi:hypothetical protein ACO1O0_002291 [Amphichorda felina]
MGRGAGAPARRLANRPLEVVWEKDGQWEQINELYRQKIAGEGLEGEEAARASQQPEFFFKTVRSWLDHRYRDCARTGTIEEMGASSGGFPTSEGSCDWPTKQILTLDSCYTGVFLASTFIVAVPAKDGEAWPKPGAMLETKEMEGAKAYLTAMFREMEQEGVNMDHAEINIFMGSDLVRGKWRPSTKEPTISRLGDKPSDEFRRSNNEMMKLSRDLPGQAMLLFLPLAFDGVVRGMLAATPGGTVWDEGELPFFVSGNNPFPHATRLLVARDYSEMEQEVEATHYKVVIPTRDPQKDSLSRILRSAEPEKEPGGIVHVTLLCGLARDAQWPLCGLFTKRPVMKAAEEALMELLKQWNREGKVRRCVAEVAMGADKSRFSFVGEEFPAPVPPNGKAPVLAKIEGDIDGFFVRLIEEPKHELFDSEGQFQAVKAMMQERMMQDPEHFKAISHQAMAAAARHFLQSNYPGTEVSDEGELSITVEGKTSTVPNTLLTVVRNPETEQKNIVAVIYSVPSPDGGLPIPLPGGETKTWLGTQELKDAVAALLELMKQWRNQGKVFEEDCMAQVMMGIDADIYQFVDGERFEDYSEERMKKLNWG